MTTELLLLIWLFCFGGCVGSFMNVVVYRLPAGLSIVRPGSRCPSCEHPIRWYHNLPVLGWLLLRGRCFDCGGKIAVRYPLVEATVGLLFAGLALGIFSGSGASQWMARVFEPRLWGVYVSLAVALCALDCAALIKYDGHRVPRVLYAWAAVAMVACAVLLRLKT